jgi:thiamine biosynthesis lipoprotein ApbE
VKAAVLVALAAALVAAGCGGKAHVAQTAPSSTTSTTLQRCNPAAKLNPAQRRKARRIEAILAAMRRAETHDRASMLTDRFLLAEAGSGLPVYARNRMIDHAIAAVTAICEDCFQALEAARPIAGTFHCG